MSLVCVCLCVYVCMCLCVCVHLFVVYLCVLLYLQHSSKEVWSNSSGNAREALVDKPPEIGLLAAQYFTKLVPFP